MVQCMCGGWERDEGLGRGGKKSGGAEREREGGGEN